MACGIARWSLVTVILWLVGATALAQAEPAATQPVPWNPAARFRMDCGQDLHRFCYGMPPGEGRLIQCLSSHRSQLSPTCISRLAAARPTRGVVSPSQNTQSPGLPTANPAMGHPVTASAMRASCGPDVQKLCAGVSSEIGGIVRCLGAHRMELSPTCDAFFKEMLARRDAQKSARKTTPPTANDPATGLATIPAAADRPADTNMPSVADGPTDTGAPSAGGDSTDMGAPSAAHGPTETADVSPKAHGPADMGTPSAASNTADTDTPSVADGPAAAPAAANDTADTGALSTANRPGVTSAAANSTADTDPRSAANSPPAVPTAVSNGAADTLAPPAADGPDTTRAPPAVGTTAATGATPTAKSPPATGALNIRL